MLTADERHEAEVLGRAQALASKGDPQGIRDLERAASSGSTLAMMVLGDAYETTPFTNVGLAEQWYRAAYDTNPTAVAGLYLGRFLYRQRRDEEARQIFTTWAKEGYGLSLFWLAVLILQDGSSWSDKKSEVRRLLERASSQGYVHAKRLLAVQMMKGRYGIREIPIGVVRFVGMLLSTLRIAMKNRNDRRLST